MWGTGLMDWAGGCTVPPPVLWCSLTRRLDRATSWGSPTSLMEAAVGHRGAGAAFRLRRGSRFRLTESQEPKQGAAFR